VDDLLRAAVTPNVVLHPSAITIAIGTLYPDPPRVVPPSKRP
jgi:hypothetical protein